MRAFCMLWACFFVLGIVAWAADFGPPENSLKQFRAIRYENVHIKVPTSGNLVSIKITDSGKVYYICREESGYVIYHLEIRPIEGFREKIENELKEKSLEWNRLHQDELLLTRDRYDSDVRQKIHKYCDAVWVRNEILVDTPTPPARVQEGEATRRHSRPRSQEPSTDTETRAAPGDRQRPRSR
ncbi:MAG: hypothetical protein FJY85_05980 [Deltaproteobacteria bacterium]|nr:hypothetical protein [Deltaproteobacteria bacterium]